MEYFFSHIGYILIAGLAIAAFAIVWSFAAEKWHKDLEEEGVDPAAGCSGGCAGCMLSVGCEKKEDHHSTAAH